MLSHLKRKLYCCIACNQRCNTYEHFEKQKNLNHSTGYQNLQSEIYADRNLKLINIAESSVSLLNNVDQKIPYNDKIALSDKNDKSEDYEDYNYVNGSDYEDSLKKRDINEI